MCVCACVHACVRVCVCVRRPHARGSVSGCEPSTSTTASLRWVVIVIVYTGMDKTCLYTSSGSLFVILSVGMSNVHVMSNVIITYHCSA